MISLIIESLAEMWHRPTHRSRGRHVLRCVLFVVAVPLAGTAAVALGAVILMVPDVNRVSGAWSKLMVTAGVGIGAGILFALCFLTAHRIK